MNRLFKYPTLISFIPSLVFIPLIFKLIINFHFGGINTFSEFLFSAFSPNLDKEIIQITFIRLIETLRTASISWLISIIFGLSFGIISSEIFYKIVKFPFFIKESIRFILTFLRSIHELVWCLIFMQIYGINESLSVIAICIPYSAVNAKVIRDQLDNIGIKKFQSITHISGHNFSSLITLIWIPVIQTINNFGLYRFECALRSTAVLGLFGIGGIGTSIYLSFQSFNFKELWTYLWGLALLILLSKIILKRIKFNINPTISLIILSLSIIIFLYSIYYSLSFLIDFNILNLNLIGLVKSSLFEIKLVPDEFLSLIFETIFLSVLAICIAIALPPILIMIFNDNFGRFFIRGISFMFRIIPPPLIILILLMFNSPSISLGALTLGLNNAAITSELLLNNLDNIGKEEFIALNSLGVPKKFSWLLGLFSKQAKSYLSYCSYRAEMIIRETIIVSTVIGIGLGWQFKESLSSFAWGEIIIILLSYSSLAILGEIINGKIKSYLN